MIQDMEAAMGRVIAIIVLVAIVAPRPAAANWFTNLFAKQSAVQTQRSLTQPKPSDAERMPSPPPPPAASSGSVQEWFVPNGPNDPRRRQ